MQNHGKTKRYKVTPASISAPLQAVLADEEQLGKGAGKRDLLAKALESESATLESAISEGERAQEIIAACKRKRGSEQVLAVVRAYESNPQIATDRWVAERLHTFLESGRQRRGRGRPAGRLSIDPFLVVAMVRLVRVRLGCSLTTALKKLDEEGVISFEKGYARYRQAMHEPRFRATLFPDKKGSFDVEAEDEAQLAKLLASRSRA